jgi:hypothetical protein
MTLSCSECGATVPEGGSCRDQFHALLVLESEIPGGPGETAHFYAVGSYVLQHPEGMGYTAQAIAMLRGQMAARLAGRATMEQVRGRVRQATDGPARVIRRPGDAATRWPVLAWPMTVADVLVGGVEGYQGRVAAWAESLIAALDAADA